MALLWFVFSNKSPRALVIGALVACLAIAGCKPSEPTPIAAPGADASNVDEGFNDGGSPDESEALETFRQRKSVKVVFNQHSFYDNFDPNNSGCAGDALRFYNPLTDQEVPVKPSWLKNVAIDITDSNASGGASNASGCGLFGGGAPPASNCATFDNLQPLNGAQSRMILMGGFGCLDAGASCVGSAPDSASPDIWHLSMSDVSSAANWGQQSMDIPEPTAGNAGGAIWSGGDYDIVHDEFYIFGGAIPSTSDPTTASTYDYSGNITRVQFNADGTVSSTNAPEVITSNVSTFLAYGGWVSNDIIAASAPTVPSARVGASFTFSSRRDPTMAQWCNGSDATQCTGGTANTLHTRNEHHDYYLLIGGLTTGGNAAAGTFSNEVYAYNPHGFSVDIGTSAATGGNWNILSNLAAVANSTSGEIMTVSSITHNGSTTEPFTVNTANTFTARGYHRTVYDAKNNRFYIFGGMTNPAAAYTATNEFWIYDPPALGRRPNAACFTNLTPSGTSIPVVDDATDTSNFFSPDDDNANQAVFNLSKNIEYFRNRFVFPPGGCLQQMNFTSTGLPDARFEHSMAFDSDQQVAMVFGGCQATPTTIPATGAAKAGDPLENCSSSTAIFNDTWIYIAPKTKEWVSRDFSTTSGPYSSTDSTRLPNIFSTQFFIDYFPKFLSGNTPSIGQTVAPSSIEAMGAWIELSPTTTPTKRVSANLVYDKAHHKYYLYGGFGCVDSTCGVRSVLNDLWEFTPPNIATECNLKSETCSSNGTWKQIIAHDTNDTTLPPARYGALMAHAQPQFATGDDFYTVWDTACIGQGPIATSDPTTNKQFVGSIYVDIDRTQFEEGEDLLLSLRMLPFDETVHLPGVSNRGTPHTTIDDTDVGSEVDQAVVRVQLLNNGLKFSEQIQALNQPRYHDFIAGTPVLGNTFQYAAGAAGQLTEKQMHIPLQIDSSVNLIKIERVSGSIKYYELTITRF